MSRKWAIRTLLDEGKGLAKQILLGVVSKLNKRLKDKHNLSVNLEHIELMQNRLFDVREDTGSVYFSFQVWLQVQDLAGRVGVPITFIASCGFKFVTASDVRVWWMDLVAPGIQTKWGNFLKDPRLNLKLVPPDLKEFPVSRAGEQIVNPEVIDYLEKLVVAFNSQHMLEIYDFFQQCTDVLLNVFNSLGHTHRYISAGSRKVYAYFPNRKILSAPTEVNMETDPIGPSLIKELSAKVTELILHVEFLAPKGVLLGSVPTAWDVKLILEVDDLLNYKGKLSLIVRAEKRGGDYTLPLDEKTSPLLEFNSKEDISQFDVYHHIRRQISEVIDERLAKLYEELRKRDIVK